MAEIELRHIDKHSGLVHVIKDVNLKVKDKDELVRLVVDSVRFTPNPIRTRGPISVSFHVVDTRGFVVRDALVFVRSTPLVTSTPPETGTRQDGWVTFQVLPRKSFPLNGKAVQFFVRARKQGDNLLAGISTRRLVQVRTAKG